MTSLHVAKADQLDTTTLYAILRLRSEVFVVEQDCPYQDVDDRDLESATVHVWLTGDGPQPLAYLRILEEPDGGARIGRVCVSPTARRRGHAGTLMAAAVDIIGTRESVLDAQSYAIELYANTGFVQAGPEFVEDGIPHVPMRRPATATVPETARPAIDVRKARAADAEALLASVTALFAEDAGARDPSFNVAWSREAGSQRFVDGAANPARLQLVADAGGDIVGHLIGMLREPTPLRPIMIAEMVGLYVRPEYRSAGLGTRFVDEFRTWAQQAGADRMTVRAFASNASAIRFYERAGFTPHSLELST